MRKVLVVGAAGFLMSNLMRYVLYRTKDFEFVGVDNLRSTIDYHRMVYLNKLHTFHVGDACDPDFIHRLVSIENPEIVVVATNSIRPDTAPMAANNSAIVLPTAVVCDRCGKTPERNTQIIRLVPNADVGDQGDQAMWDYVESMVLGVGGRVLRLPTCFGRRGNGMFEDALRIIATCPTVTTLHPDQAKKRYAYAEDVASMIWFMIEHPDVGPVVSMPSIGVASEADMLAASSDIHGWTGAKTRAECEPGDATVHGWEPDVKDIVDAVRKTAKWYMMNKWICKNTWQVD